MAKSRESRNLGNMSRPGLSYEQFLNSCESNLPKLMLLGLHPCRTFIACDDDTVCHILFAFSFLNFATVVIVVGMIMRDLTVD